MSDSRVDRIVIGATGDDSTARLQARALLMSGREVVFVGGEQSVEQMARTALAEDAGTVVVDGTDAERAAVEAALAALGLRGQVHVRGCDQPDAPPQRNCG